jgi:hypothetical protein
MREKNNFSIPGSLPEIVKKWLKYTGVERSEFPLEVELRQKGKMKTSQKGKWLPFHAEQVYKIQEPSFVWTAKVQLFPFVYLHGRDELRNGKGEMTIKLASFISLVHEKGNLQVDSGTMLRYLGEICWFPMAASQPYLHWEELDGYAVKATFTQNDLSVNGIFTFSPEGRLLSFEAFRYYGGGKGAVERKWIIEILKENTFEGMRLPSHCRVTWKLPGGNFTWLELHVTDVKYSS